MKDNKVVKRNEIIEKKKKTINWGILIGILMTIISCIPLVTDIDVKSKTWNNGGVWFPHWEREYYISPKLIFIVFILGILITCFSILFRRKEIKLNKTKQDLKNRNPSVEDTHYSSVGEAFGGLLLVLLHFLGVLIIMGGVGFTFLMFLTIRGGSPNAFVNITIGIIITFIGLLMANLEKIIKGKNKR